MPSPRAFARSWAEGTAGRCQLAAAAALGFELHRRLADSGVTACVADAGIAADELLLPPFVPGVATPAAVAAAAAAHAAAVEWPLDGEDRAAPDDLR